MNTHDQITVTNREYGITQFCEQLCEEGEFGIFWRLLETNWVYWLKVRRRKHQKCITAVLYRLLTRWGICLSILPGTIKYLPQYEAVC